MPGSKHEKEDDASATDDAQRHRLHRLERGSPQFQDRLLEASKGYSKYNFREIGADLGMK